MEQQVKLLPYGVADFVTVIEQNLYYVDKTMFIPELEKQPRNYMDAGCPPEEMIDPNTRTDYGKMKKLLQFDKLDGERKGIIRKIAEEEQIVTQLYESFSAYQIPKAEIFPSLLFYYGMLTIKGTRGSKLILGIPNNNVRKQYYGYLEEEYQAKAYVDVNQLTDYWCQRKRQLKHLAKVF